MSNINPVRYANPSSNPPAWQQVLAGMIQGGAGQMVMNQNQQAKERDDNMKAMMSILPALAQQNRLNPATAGTPGAMNFGGQSWSVGAPPIDYGNMKNKAEMEKMQWEQQNPDAAMFRKAATSALAEAAGPYNPGDQDASVLRALQAYRTMQTGEGPIQEGTPAKAGFLGMFGNKPATPPTRKAIVNNKLVTLTQQADGTWADATSAKAAAPAKKGKYSVGDEITRGGKTYVVVGGDMDDPDVRIKQ